MFTNCMASMKGQPFSNNSFTVTISNPAEPGRYWEGLFLLDCDSVESAVPKAQLEAIGLFSFGNRKHLTTGGAEAFVDATGARLSFLGEVVYATVIMSDDQAPPVLGRTALLSAGIEIDPLPAG